MATFHWSLTKKIILKHPSRSSHLSPLYKWLISNSIHKQIENKSTTQIISTLLYMETKFYNYYNSFCIVQTSNKMVYPLYEANHNSPNGNLTTQEFFKKHRILPQESFMLNKSNKKIFTQSWQPADSTHRHKGLVGIFHGYTSESSWLFELNAVAIAKAGFFVWS